MKEKVKETICDTHWASRFAHPATQWSQDLDYAPGPSHAIRQQEDSQGVQEGVRLQWYDCG